jgi:hypothetical protein
LPWKVTAFTVVSLPGAAAVTHGAGDG